MKKRFSLSVSFWCSVACLAQQDVQLSQYFMNKSYFNPAVAGMNHAICGTLAYRTQWVNFPGAPVTKILGVNGFVPQFRGGAALNLSSDVLGNESNTHVNLSLARHFNLGLGELSIGLGAEMIQKKFAGLWLATDGVSGDAAIPQVPSSGSYFDLHAGAYYMGLRGQYAGLSVRHIYSKDAKSFVYDYRPHYFVMAGWPVQLPFARSVVLKPSVLGKSDGASTIFDVNLLAQFADRFWAGMSYRMTDAVVGMAGLQWGNLKVGYSYDITTSALKNHSSDSHELVITYCHKIVGKKKCTSHENPRIMKGGNCKCDQEAYSGCLLHQKMTQTGYWE
ncbi:MAG: type IX secretion system membrane protein PorP/SprF [Bacteroidota bacterium]